MGLPSQRPDVYSQPISLFSEDAFIHLGESFVKNQSFNSSFVLIVIQSVSYRINASSRLDRIRGVCQAQALLYIENRGLGESIFAQQHVRAHSGYPGKQRDWVKHQKLASNRENKPRRESTGEEKITESRLKLSKVKF